MHCEFDVAIIGAGAAGLMCAVAAGKRRRKVLVLDHTPKAAEKIRISGGGRCNFTNLYAAPDRYISCNPKFCISALKQYTVRDFVSLVEKHGIPYHEKTLGQLFCDGTSQAIIDLLIAECRDASVEIRLSTAVEKVTRTEAGFELRSTGGSLTCRSLVIASGGLSIPKMGATPFGYRIAEQFGLNIVPPRAGLVPFTFSETQLQQWAGMAGVATDCVATYRKTSFRERMLFTHRGLSGPAILQISSYWQPGEEITLNMAPKQDVGAMLVDAKRLSSKQDIASLLPMPKRLAQRIVELHAPPERLRDTPDRTLKQIGAFANSWVMVPHGTEGYRTAEVTVGGVDTDELSSKTMESKKVPGLYFIGEVVDVTGHLGGFNFQWAWSSGFVAGQYA